MYLFLIQFRLMPPVHIAHSNSWSGVNNRLLPKPCSGPSVSNRCAQHRCCNQSRHCYGRSRNPRPIGTKLEASSRIVFIVTSLLLVDYCFRRRGDPNSYTRPPTASTTKPAGDAFMLLLVSSPMSPAVSPSKRPIPNWYCNHTVFLSRAPERRVLSNDHSCNTGGERLPL